MHRLLSRFLLPLLALALAGCSQPKPPANLEYDSGRARQTLTTALDAWKQGRADQLGAAMPPVRFVDDDLLDGWQLLDFQLPDPAVRFAPFSDIPVALVLRDSRSNIVKRSATYQVGLEPQLAVLRTDR